MTSVVHKTATQRTVTKTEREERQLNKRLVPRPKKFDRLWPNRFWPSQFLFNRLWPSRLWPKLVFQSFGDEKNNTKKGWAPNPRNIGSRRVGSRMVRGSSGGSEGGGPEGWGAQNFAFFSFSRSHCRYFRLSFRCLLVEFCLKLWVLEMGTFGVLGLTCETPAAQWSVFQRSRYVSSQLRLEDLSTDRICGDTSNHITPCRFESSCLFESMLPDFCRQQYHILAVHEED